MASDQNLMPRAKNESFINFGASTSKNVVSQMPGTYIKASAISVPRVQPKEQLGGAAGKSIRPLPGSTATSLNEGLDNNKKVLVTLPRSNQGWITVPQKSISFISNPKNIKANVNIETPSMSNSQPTGIKCIKRDNIGKMSVNVLTDITNGLSSKPGLKQSFNPVKSSSCDKDNLIDLVNFKNNWPKINKDLIKQNPQLDGTPFTLKNKTADSFIQKSDKDPNLTINQKIKTDSSIYNPDSGHIAKANANSNLPVYKVSPLPKKPELKIVEIKQEKNENNELQTNYHFDYVNQIELNSQLVKNPANNIDAGMVKLDQQESEVPIHFDFSHLGELINSSSNDDDDDNNDDDDGDNTGDMQFEEIASKYQEDVGKEDIIELETMSQDDLDIDARLQAELDSLIPSGIEYSEPKNDESDIDARLQAELDSLPFVEVDNEEDNQELGDFMKSLFCYEGRPQGCSDTETKPSNPPTNQQMLPRIAYNPGPSTNASTSRQNSHKSNAYASQEKSYESPYKNLNVLNNNYSQTLVVNPQPQYMTPKRTYGYFKNANGEDTPVSFVIGPDGLVTNVSLLTSATCPNSLPSARNMESLTAVQLDQILQSGQSYLELPSELTAPIDPEPTQFAQPEGAVNLPETPVEDEEADYEEIGVSDTFAEYWPSKLKLGMAHPDPVVETATLSSVELPDINIKLALSKKFQISGALSALQMEAVVYACQAHEQILPSGERAGFLLGDGAGVGKGRAIAGIIYENYLQGRKRSLWISVSSDLKFDAERDLFDIGADVKIPVVALNKFKYSRIDSHENESFKKGVIFCTYTSLIGESHTSNRKYKTRLLQLVHWLTKKFDGVIVFDECHKAKNLSLMNVSKSTKTGTTVLELQQLCPNARVVYASATGASEPRNMAYMVRLGLWGPGTAYTEFFDFVNAVEKRGIGAMEIVAMDMKLRGTYIARQLSFKDVSFRIEEVVMSREFRKIYNMSAELWAEIHRKFQKACRLMCIENRVQKIITCQFWCAHQRFFKNLCIASKVAYVVKMTRLATRMGKAVVIGLQSTGESRTLEHLDRHQGRLNTFVSTSKMIIQSFVEKHFPAPKRETFHHLLNTGEFVPESHQKPSRAKRPRMNSDWDDDDGGDDDDEDAEAAESDIEMFENSWMSDDDETQPSRAKGGSRKRRGRPPNPEKGDKITMQERILQHLCNNMREQAKNGEPIYITDNSKPQKGNITERDVERCINSREILLDKIESLGRRLPPNTLDKLIAELGGPNLVAEMTGRRGRVVRTEYEGFKYESRCDSDATTDFVNYREKQRFMEGSKHVAIISEAASSGISLQSDKRVSNQRRRLHITLELPWSADRAIQQFGRTHRSNQINSPEYVFVITDLAGERRFASTVAKRLESLGALTQGDRRATDARDLSQFNIDNSIGRSALESVMQQITRQKPLDRSFVPQSFKGDFIHDCALAMAGVGMLNVKEEGKNRTITMEKDSNNISKFLNRILGCRVEIQNALFKFFLNKMYSLISQMKRLGHFDLGILDLDAHGASVKAIKLVRFVRKHTTGTAATELHTITVERGMSFEVAMAKYRKESQFEYEGFYILQQDRQNKNASILCLHAAINTSHVSNPNKINLQIFRPNTGPQVRTESLTSITNRYVKVSPDVAHPYWLQQYDMCLTMCTHVFWNRICPYPPGCEVGLRLRTYHVLSGLMLPIWDRIELIIGKNNHKIQIIRVKTDTNKKIVGTVVPHNVYDELFQNLAADSLVEHQKITKNN